MANLSRLPIFFEHDHLVKSAAHGLMAKVEGVPDPQDFGAEIEERSTIEGLSGEVRACGEHSTQLSRRTAPPSGSTSTRGC